MSIFKSLLTAIVLGAATSAHAAYTTGFGDAPGDAIYNGGLPAQALAGQDGWTITSNAHPLLSWVTTLNGSQAGAIGGFYGAPPASYGVAHAYAGDFSSTSLSLDFAIGSNNALESDSYGFTIFDGANSPLFTLTLTPSDLDPDIYEAFINGSSTGSAILEGGDYNYSVSFSVGLGGFVDYTATLAGSTTEIFNGSTLVPVGAQIGSVGASYVAVGDTTDVLYFDNLSVVPEPTGLALAGVALGGMMLRRRRA